MPKVLKYKGPGFFDGVPASDLTDEDVRGLPPEWTAEKLIATGKYSAVSAQADALADADKAHTRAVKAEPKAASGG